MLTLILGLCIATTFGFIGYLIYPSYILSTILFAISLIIFNVFMSRYFMKKLTDIFSSCEKDLKSGRTDIAIEKMKKGYAFSKWQFLVKQQIDSQIGVILYANKRFDEALPYLEKTPKSNFMAMSMLAAHYFRHKDFEKVKKVMATSAKANKKDSFTQVLNGYFLSEMGFQDEAIAALTKANKKLPTDERIENALDSVRNNKKIKMQGYGALWMQLHLMKMQEGVKQYQTLIGRQKIKRR